MGGFLKFIEVFAELFAAVGPIRRPLPFYEPKKGWHCPDKLEINR